MKNEILKLKKYLLLISIVFFILPCSHLIYSYLYYDAELIPVKGGSVSEGLIGNFPSLNPFKAIKGNNKYIIDLLYRSILRYDIQKKQIVSDIASCDIGNLNYIECYIEDNISWSNGESINVTDIIATYKILQNTNINPVIQSLLSETEISGENNIVTFKNKKSDINFLNVLLHPIVSKKIIDTLGDEKLRGDFSTIDSIYSGRYKIINVSRDLTVGVTKFILEKNSFYKNNPVIIEQLILKLFATPNNLLRNKESINIFNDTNNLIGESVPRFELQQYSLPQYVGLFLNKDKIQDTDLRSFLLNQISTENLIKILGENNFKTVTNPYLTDFSTQGTTRNKNLENLIAKLGYYKKPKLLDDIRKENESLLQKQETDKNDNENIPLKTLEDFQEDSQFIIFPEYVDKYNFITKNKSVLKGITPENTTEVYINNTKIESFQPNDKYFYFPLAGNIQKGENVYNIYFRIDAEKKLFEEVTFIYDPNKQNLQQEQKKLVAKLIGKEKEELRKQLEKIEKTNSTKTKEAIERIEALEDNFYYNKEGEKFSLDVLYILGEEAMEKTALYVKNTLESIGIHIKLRPIALNQLRQVMGNKKEYDMILTGINLGYFPFNLFPYLHSSQVKKGYNFSNIRKTSLDILLEETKGDTLGETKITSLQSKILDILQKEQIVKTLYTPKISILIDKNIKNTQLSEYMPNKSLRSEIFNNIYVLDKKIINFSNKSVGGFFSFIISKLNDSYTKR